MPTDAPRLTPPLRPWIVCSCGNLVQVGTAPRSERERVEHPACGREPNRIHIPRVCAEEDDAALSRATKPLEFTRRGLPLLTNEEKAEALLECVREGHSEDALGHALDLVERLRGHEGMIAARNRYGTLSDYEDYVRWCERRRCPGAV